MIKKKIYKLLLPTNGFTIVELIVSLSIVATLSAIVLAGTTQYIEKSRITKAQVEMNQIVKAIAIAQNAQGKPLISFAPHSNCGHCYCSDMNSQECLDNWKLAIAEIEAATNGLMPGISRTEKDPWNHPYLIDANQGEGGAGTCSNVDGFWVSGKSIPGVQPIPLSAVCP